MRRTQDRIISQQKLAELGELSAGVAHEIRNPLHFIKNFAISSDLLIRELETLLEQPDLSGRESDREEARDLIRDISEALSALGQKQRPGASSPGLLLLPLTWVV